VVLPGLAAAYVTAVLAAVCTAALDTPTLPIVEDPELNALLLIPDGSSVPASARRLDRDHVPRFQLSAHLRR
jgi:hypothetical protein